MKKEIAAKIIESYEVNSCGYCHQGGPEVEEAFRMAADALKNPARPCKVRLINADEIKKREHDVILENGAKHRCFDTTQLYEIPTVEAIPVEWLKEQYPIHGIYATEQYFRTAYAVQELLAEWERARQEQ